jgi:hypothetical protein
MTFPFLILSMMMMSGLPLPPGEANVPIFALAGREVRLAPGAAELVRKDRRTAGGETLRVTVPMADGKELALALQRFEVVTGDAVAVRDGREDPSLLATARAVVHLRGRVEGWPQAIAYLAISDRGATGLVDLGVPGERHVLVPAERAVRGLSSGPLRLERSVGVGGPGVEFCGVPAGEQGGVAGFGAVPTGRERRIDIAADCDFEFFATFGDAAATVEYVTALYGAISTIFRRDCDANVAVSFVRVFTSPEDLFNEPDPLGPFRDHWQADMGAVERDVAQLLTGRRNLPYGGVAWLNAACGEFGYSVNGYLNGRFADPVGTDPGNWDINVVAHELGHNVGTLHTHNYGADGCASGVVQRGTIMSYCHVVSGASANIDLSFHRVTANAIENFLVSAACLAVDCDADGNDDADEIAGNPSLDANGDGILDACQDCDADGTLDPDEIAAGALDLDLDGRPDACEPDCNANGVPDDVDIAVGTSVDAHGNGQPDECEEDCDADGISDLTEINLDMSLDRSRDGRLDACEDCDGDGTPDLAELAGSCGIWVVSGDADLRELHPRSGVFLRSVDLGTDPVVDLEVGPDGSPVAVTEASIRRIDRVSGAVTTLAMMPVGVRARAIDWRPDGSFLLATAGGGIRIHAADGGFLGWLAAAGGPMNPAGPVDPVDLVVTDSADVLVIDRAGDDSIVRRFGPSGEGTILVPRGNGEPRDFRQAQAIGGGEFLVVDAAARMIRHFASDGRFVRRFDVGPGNLLQQANGIAATADGQAVVATGAASASTVNGYRLGSGYTERTYRIFPADAGAARLIAVAPPSDTDRNGNLVPDECERSSADLDGDGAVGAGDLAILLAGWGGSGPADLDRDGTVGAADLVLLLAAWD